MQRIGIFDSFPYPISERTSFNFYSVNGKTFSFTLSDITNFYKAEESKDQRRSLIADIWIAKIEAITTVFAASQ